MSEFKEKVQAFKWWKYVDNHMKHNHFPPLPDAATDVAVKAIELWNSGNQDKEVVEILDQWSLWEFVFTEEGK